MTSLLYSPDEQKKIILTNLVKMLSNRKILKNELLDENINKTLKNYKQDTFIFENIIVKLINQKITSSSKGSFVYQFLNNKEYKDKAKILIVNEINPRISQTILDTYKNVEVFSENELMINIVDHILVPLHQVLDENEKEEFLTAYKIKKTEMPIIPLTDPIARYYNMKKGDICRIIRPSDITGETVYYRLVESIKVK